MIKKIMAMIVQSHTRSDRLSMRGPDGYGTSIRTVLQDSGWQHGDSVTIMKTSDATALEQCVKELECCANCTYIDDCGDHFKCNKTKAILENYEVLNLQLEPCEDWKQRKIK